MGSIKAWYKKLTKTQRRWLIVGLVVLILVGIGNSESGNVTDHANNGQNNVATSSSQTKDNNKDKTDKTNKTDVQADESAKADDQKTSPSNTIAPQPQQPSPQPAAPANHTNPDYKKLPACNVTRVSDGDTLHVDCLSERIRLVGVDTPESTNKHQCFGNEASNHTKGLAGQRVYLETDPASGDIDTYGRPLRFVYLADGTNYNMQLIEDGYGMLYIFKGQRFNYLDKFAAAQDAAKSAGKGLWSACRTAINKYGNYQVVN